MPSRTEPASTGRPFALLTVTSHPEGGENVVGLSFHTARGTERSPAVEVACHVYEDQAPILALRQGRTHMSLTPADPRVVDREDVLFAKELVGAALRYYQDLHRRVREKELGA